MVRENPLGDVGPVGRPVGNTTEITNAGQQAAEFVGLPDRVHASEHAEDPLQAKTGVYRGRWQLGHRPIVVLLELHEDEVPNLDEPLVVAVSRPTGVAELWSLVPEDLRARATRSGVGHSPVVVLIQTLDPFGGDAHLIAPDGRGLVIAHVHGDPQPLRIEPKVGSHELPREGTRLRFEVVAEAEVAHHLEEREVAAGATHLIEVVVLATGPDALLDGDSPRPWCRLLTHEVRLEWHHPGHGEKECGVVRDQTSRNLVLVAVSRKEVNEGASNSSRGEQVVGRDTHDRPSLWKSLLRRRVNSRRRTQRSPGTERTGRRCRRCWLLDPWW